MKIPTINELISTYDKLNYKLYTKGNYNLNIFGIRNNEDKDSNAFNDIIGVLYKINNIWHLNCWPATVDPGLNTRINPVNANGTAILPAGQYIGLFKLGKHKNKYNALVQNIPVKVIRDYNKDSKLDFDSEKSETGMFGINLHHAGDINTSIRVDNWSAGCQVIASISDWNSFMNLVNKSVEIFGSKSTFTYTLFNEQQIVSEESR